MSVLSILTLTFKGLLREELIAISGMNLEEWNLLLVFFKSFFFTFRGLWKITNESFKKLIQKKYLSDKAIVREYHVKIATQLEKTKNDIRKLEEQTNHLFAAQDYDELKHTISDIENFLILFNPYTKYELSRYWQALEVNGYDPVAEYSKRLETFEVHFSPNPEDLFTIILQISRFLKEFADFENHTTPKYRHPYIKGKAVHVEESENGFNTDAKAEMDIETFLLGEARSSKMYQAEQSTFALQPFVNSDDDADAEETPIHSTREENNSKSHKLEYMKVLGLQDEIENMKMTEAKAPFVLTDHEKLNVAVTSGKVIADKLRINSSNISETKLKRTEPDKALSKKLKYSLCTITRNPKN